MTDRGTFYDRMAKEADWDEWTNRYETHRRLHIVFDRLLSRVDLRGAQVLDAGCGGGHFSQGACERGAQVTSLDVGEHLLSQVARRCESERVVGSVLELPFEPASFDVVLSTEVVEHTTDPERALRELVRVLRPSGYLAMTTPSRLWQPVVRLASKLGLRPYQGYENFVWPRVARRILESEGLAVDQYFGFNLLPLFNTIFERFHGLGDRVGPHLPWLCVNFAIGGRKTSWGACPSPTRRVSLGG